MKIRHARIAIAILLMTSSIPALADSNVIHWNTGTGADGNYYQRVDVHSATPLTFATASADASAMTYNPGSGILTGRLAVLTPNYSAAFSFLQSNVVYGSTGSGAAPSNEQYWVGASSPDGNVSPNNWTWVNGVAVDSSIVNTWNIDHYEGPGPEGIGFYQNGSTQLWDYLETAPSNLAYGYVVEFVPTAEPSALVLVIVSIAAAIWVMR